MKTTRFAQESAAQAQAEAQEKQAQHSPGPWSIGQIRESRGYPSKSFEALVCVGEGKSQGNALAIVGLGGPGATQYTSEAVLSNARLIAAAPELLEALRAVLSDFTPEHLDKIGVSNCGTLARVAIAKATGK